MSGPEHGAIWMREDRVRSHSVPTPRGSIYPHLLPIYRSIAGLELRVGVPIPDFFFGGGVFFLRLGIILVHGNVLPQRINKEKCSFHRVTLHDQSAAPHPTPHQPQPFNPQTTTPPPHAPHQACLPPRSAHSSECPPPTPASRASSHSPTPAAPDSYSARNARTFTTRS